MKKNLFGEKRLKKLQTKQSRRIDIEEFNKRLKELSESDLCEELNIISLKELAKLTGYKIRTLRKWAKNNQIQSHKQPNGRYYFKRKEINFILDKKVFSVKEVADKINKSCSSVYALIKKNKIAAFRIGKKWYIKQEDLKDFFETRWEL